MPLQVFYDRLGPVNSGTLRVLARIQVVRTEDGGRRGPFKGPFRPNHNFGSSDNTEFFIGQIEVPGGGWVQPGETRDLEIIFLNAKELFPLLDIGTRWRIQEGPKLIASAELLAFLA